MLGVGQKFPSFSMKATVSSDIATAFKDVSNDSYKDQWLVVFFWPKDFTFVCPTEISAFGEMYDTFKQRNTQILGASIDTEFVHLAWRQNHPHLTDLPFPMLADVKRELSTALGILDPEAGVAQRATYIVDPEGVIRFVSVTDLNVGRNVGEVLRVLDALQNGGLCPCNWKKGESTIKVA
ncbi:MAG TPA: alkyl hydroperoxide reductase [Rhodospirillaceae bacterium]|jgi:peroxiredoxin (alkyl hydroperoxide reductase subunit C)|nr:alkyl hydroperoxide reductase [Rhodospirillaceae bacterium]